MTASIKESRVEFWYRPMARHIVMWIAVVSLIGLAIASAITSFVMYFGFGSGGWTFYSPYPPATPTFEMRMLDISRYAQNIFLPLGGLSSGIYILLLDRAVRRGSTNRGFEVAHKEARHDA